MTGPLVDDPALLEPVTLRIAGDCPGYALSRVRVRGHVVAIDEPPERGGTDEGPAPTETLVAALVGVSNVILRRIARRDGIAIRTLSVAAEAVLDRRGVWLAAIPGAIADAGPRRGDQADRLHGKRVSRHIVVLAYLGTAVPVR